MRRQLFTLCGALVLCATVAELGAAVAIRALNPRLQEPIRRTADIFDEQSRLIRELLSRDVEQLHEIHPILGWRYAPNYNKGLHQLNGSALRAGREYTGTPPAGVFRIAAFGDSFVYGSDVANADAWPALMEGDPGLEVLNYGVPGYGSDQAYLRYELEGSGYSPDLVLLGFPPTDLSRVVNVYKRFFNNSEVPLFKPRFVLDDAGDLSLRPSPVRSRADYEGLLERPRDVIRFAEEDQWFEAPVYKNALYDYSALVRLGSAALFRFGRSLDKDRLVQDGLLNRNSTAFTIQVKLFERFASLARARKTRLLVVLFPDRAVLQAVREGDPVIYQPVIHALEARGIEYADAAEAFRSAAGHDNLWFTPVGHYSAQGNRTVAAWLSRIVRDRFPLKR